MPVSYNMHECMWQNINAGLGRLVYDNREKVRSSVHVQLKERRDKVLSIYKIHPSERHESSEDVVDAQLRRRRVSSRREHHEDSIVENVHHNTGGVQVNVSNSFMPIPSSEVREAIRHFRLAVDAAIEIADRNFLLTAAITEVEQ